MSARRRRDRGGWIAAVLAVAVVTVLAASPWRDRNPTQPPWAAAVAANAASSLPHTAEALAPLRLSSVARPQAADGGIARVPSNDSIHMAALVAAEDSRLRTIIHRSGRVRVPQVIAVVGSLPTLVLPARGGHPYTVADLQALGAVTPLSGASSFLLVDNVLVASLATLDLGGAGLTRLLMNSTRVGSASLVTWEGTIRLHGVSAQAPLTVIGWDQQHGVPAPDSGYGRPYIRADGGELDLAYANVSSLGFWSGRTGGVAWTGVSKRSATGGAVSSSFTGDTYGAFLSRTEKVSFSDDRFESNELDGVRVHRGADSTTVTHSSAARNGGNGFVVSRAATGTVFEGDLAVHNGGNGFLLDGQPLSRSGASPSGDRSVATSGTVAELGEAQNNVRTGILVEGGTNTLVSRNLVCSTSTAIAVRAGATNTSIVGNDVTCGGRVALSIGPAVVGTTVSGNRLNQARIGILIRNAPGVRLLHNTIGGISVFGVSVRGDSPGVVGNDNVIAGLGLSAVDTRAGAPAPQLSTTNTSGWQHRTQLTVLGYLRYHPLLVTWVTIALVVIVWTVLTRSRRRPVRPYRHPVLWTTHDDTGSTPLMWPAPPGYATRSSKVPAEGELEVAGRLDRAWHLPSHAAPVAVSADGDSHPQGGAPREHP